MRKISLSDLASISEVAALVVVVISLAYIYVEIRQNTKAQHNASWQNVIGKMVDIDLQEASDPALTKIVMTGEAEPEKLDKLQRGRFSKIGMARLGLFEYVYLAMINGTFDDSDWQAMSGYLHVLLCTPGYQKLWNGIGTQLWHPIFVEYAMELMANCSVK